jgi:hypothetical protein
LIDPKLILLFAGFVALLATNNIVRMLRTGVARNWLAQTATRAGQPTLYWRYVYSSYAVVAFCAATFLWASLWPDSLR